MVRPAVVVPVALRHASARNQEIREVTTVGTKDLAAPIPVNRLKVTWTVDNRQAVDNKQAVRGLNGKSTKAGQDGAVRIRLISIS